MMTAERSVSSASIEKEVRTNCQETGDMLDPMTVAIASGMEPQDALLKYGGGRIDNQNTLVFTTKEGVVNMSDGRITAWEPKRIPTKKEAFFPNI
jgi:hypothetical protein